MRRRTRHLFVVAVLLAGRAAGQDLITSFQLSLSNPGARSLALGGAFVALADDATAAFANPAGLVQLTRAEVSLEGRSWRYSTPFVRGGRAGGTPTGIGIDVSPGVSTDRSSVDLTGVSFLSGVLPLGKWTVAFYRHQLANFESSFETQSIFIDHPDGSIGALLPRRGGVDLEAVSHGVAAGFRLGETLWLGVGVSRIRVDATGSLDIYFPDDASSPDLSGTISLGPTSFLPERRWLAVEVEGRDSDLVFNIGLLWVPHGSWRIGGFYRQGPRATGGSVAQAGAFHPQPAGTVLDSSSGRLGLPDVFGLGVARRFLADRVTLSFEWDRVEYTAVSDEPDRIDDGDELHLGVEYARLQAVPVLAFRAGAWLDPDHSIRGPKDNPLLSAFFPRGRDELHYTAGLGVALERFQLDLGIDLSELSDTASLSAIYRF